MGIAVSHIQPDPFSRGEGLGATSGSAGNGSTLQEIMKGLQGQRFRTFDVATLTRVLQEAERVMGKTESLLRSAMSSAASSPALRRAKAQVAARGFPPQQGLQRGAR